MVYEDLNANKVNYFDACANQRLRPLPHIRLLGKTQSCLVEVLRQAIAINFVVLGHLCHPKHVYIARQRRLALQFFGAVTQMVSLPVSVALVLIVDMEKRMPQLLLRCAVRTGSFLPEVHFVLRF